MRTRYTVQHLVGALLSAILLVTSYSRDQPAPDVLTGDVRVHDPGMIRQGSTYYVFSTGDERGLNQGNIQIRKSRDLAHWELVGTVFETTPSWIGDELGGIPPNLWAPDISYFNGAYHLFYYAGSRFDSNTSVFTIWRGRATAGRPFANHNQPLDGLYHLTAPHFR